MNKLSFPWSRRLKSDGATTGVECGWLPSGPGFVGATWYRAAAKGTRRTAVLIVPGIAHEERTMAEGLAALARSLAGAGFGTLLIDLHGTAQSSGRLDAADIGERWRQDIRSAVGHLRAGGCEAVIVVGVRVGALLAQDALKGEGVAGFVAWAPVLSGRRHVRELKMLRASAAAATTGDTSDKPRSDTSGSLSVAGHDIPKTVLTCLAARDFDPAAWQLPTLVLDDVEPVEAVGIPASPAAGTAALPSHFEHRQAALLQRWLFQPDDVPVLPKADIRTVVDWCRRHDPMVASGPPTRRLRPALLKEISLACDGLAVRERAVRIGRTGLSGVVSEPMQRQANGSARLLATLVGPGRIFPSMARTEAALGKTSLRFDFAGFSSSGRRADGSGGELYATRNRDDVAEAVAWLMRAGHEAVSMVGFCAGGWSMLQAGPLPGVSGIVGINVALYRQPDYRPADLVLQPGHPVAKALSLLRRAPPLARSIERIERRLPLALETGRWLQRLAGATAPPVLLVYSTDDSGLHHLDRRRGRAVRSAKGSDEPNKGTVHLKATGHLSERISIGRHAGLGHLLEGSSSRGRALDAVASYLAEVDRGGKAGAPRLAAPVIPTRRQSQRDRAPAVPDPAHWEGTTWAHSR